MQLRLFEGLVVGDTDLPFLGESGCGSEPELRSRVIPPAVAHFAVATATTRLTLVEALAPEVLLYMPSRLSDAFARANNDVTESPRQFDKS